MVNEFNHIYDGMIRKVKSNCDEQIKNLNATLKLLHEECFNDFCAKCDEHCRQLADDFDKAMALKFKDYDSRIKQFEITLSLLEQKVKNKADLPICSSPVRSSYNMKTPPKQTTKNFGPTKSFTPSQYDNNTIPQYFKTSLEFWHQADRYYLLDKEYLKNSPKLEPPSNVEDALSIYSQIQKNALI